MKSDAAAELIKERLKTISAWAIGLLLAIAAVIVLGLTYAHLNDHISDKTKLQDYQHVIEKNAISCVQCFYRMKIKEVS